MAKNDFKYGRWNSYTVQCGTITTLINIVTVLRRCLHALSALFFIPASTWLVCRSVRVRWK